MERKIRSVTAGLLAAILFAMPALVFGQQAIEMPAVVYDQQPIEEKTATLPQPDKPIVQILTVGNMVGKNFLSLLEGVQLTAQDYPAIGELTGFGIMRIDNQPVQSATLRSGNRVQVGAASCARAELSNHGQILLSSG